MKVLVGKTFHFVDQFGWPMFVVFASIQGIPGCLVIVLWILLTVSQQILVFNVNTDTY